MRNFSDEQFILFFANQHRELFNEIAGDFHEFASPTQEGHENVRKALGGIRKPNRSRKLQGERVDDQEGRPSVEEQRARIDKDRIPKRHTKDIFHEFKIMPSMSGKEAPADIPAGMRGSASERLGRYNQYRRGPHSGKYNPVTSPGRGMEKTPNAPWRKSYEQHRAIETGGHRDTTASGANQSMGGRGKKARKGGDAGLQQRSRETAGETMSQGGYHDDPTRRGGGGLRGGRTARTGTPGFDPNRKKGAPISAWRQTKLGKEAGWKRNKGRMGTEVHPDDPAQKGGPSWATDFPKIVGQGGSHEQWSKRSKKEPFMGKHKLSESEFSALREFARQGSDEDWNPPEEDRSDEHRPTYRHMGREYVMPDAGSDIPIHKVKQKYRRELAGEAAHQRERYRGMKGVGAFGRTPGLGVPNPEGPIPGPSKYKGPKLSEFSHLNEFDCKRRVALGRKMLRFMEGRYA